MKRYNFQEGYTCNEDCHACMVEAPDGKYVLFSDHGAQSELSEYAERLRGVIREEIDRDATEYAALVDRITKERDEARATATRYMEEAEKLRHEKADEYSRAEEYRSTLKEVHLRHAGQRVPLAKIAERMDGQDNRATANPIFIVQQRRRVYGMDTDWTGKDIWLYDGEDFAETEDELERFLRENDLGSEEDCLERGDLVKTGYVDTFEFVQPFFSRKAADDYIETNRHNLTDPRVYVESAYRNEEWQAVRGVLLEMVERSNSHEL